MRKTVIIPLDDYDRNRLKAGQIVVREVRAETDCSVGTVGLGTPWYIVVIGKNLRKEDYAYILKKGIPIAPIEITDQDIEKMEKEKQIRIITFKDLEVHLIREEYYQVTLEGKSEKSVQPRRLDNVD